MRRVKSCERQAQAAPPQLPHATQQLPGPAPLLWLQQESWASGIGGGQALDGQAAQVGRANLEEGWMAGVWSVKDAGRARSSSGLSPTPTPTATATLRYATLRYGRA